MFKLLVCDLDDTLYGWRAFFVPAFYAMIEVVETETGWDREELLDQLRFVHQAHDDSEHPYALLETPLVRNTYPSETRGQLKNRFQAAFDAFNEIRDKRLRTFTGVHETLGELRSNGIRLVAHSDAKLHAILDRMTQLNLFSYFDRVYCRERPDRIHPNGLSDEERHPDVAHDKIVELTQSKLKPDERVLLEICDGMKIAPKECAYIGDSISHDVMMAKNAGVFSIFASYGTHKDPKDWDKLVRVSHWTPERVEREAKLGELAQSIQADFVAKSEISEIFTLFQ